MGGPSFAAYAVASLLWVVLGVVPGLLLVTWLTPARSRLDRLAVAPLLSIVLGFAPASWLSAVRVPHAWHAAWVVPVVVSLVLLVRLGRDGSLRALVRRTRSVDAVALALVASTIVWVASLALSSAGFGAVVPNTDGNSHGVFVARILLSGSVSPDQVAVFDLADPGAQSVFYPLGLHALAAPVAALTSVPSALLVPFTALGSAWCVVGVTALACRASGPRALGPAAFAAAMVVPWFPFVLAGWGPVPLVVGVSLVPGLALALVDARSRPGVLAAGLATGGMLALHTTEALVAVGLAILALVLGAVAGTQVVRRVGAVVLCAVLGALVVAPVVVGLATGGASRLTEPTQDRSLIASLGWALVRPFLALDAIDDPSAAVVVVALLAAGAALVLAVTGALVMRRTPTGRAVLVAVLGLLVVAVLGRSGTPTLLSYPWYGDDDRLVAQVAALLPVLLGAGWLALSRRATSTGARRAAVAAAVAVSVVLAGQSAAAARDGFTRYSVVTDDDLAAFAWLSTHVQAGERVLNDHRDGSVWSYEASDGVLAPVFGPKPSGGYEADPAFVGRLYLRDHIHEVATDARVADEARRWSVRYVMVGSRTFSDADRQLEVPAPGLREVFRSGQAVVYEIIGE
jgi:hypothetical protein